MDPYEIRRGAELYERGDHANGLMSGVGKRQWQMAKAFFLYSSLNPEFRLSAYYDFAPRVFTNGNRVGAIVMYPKNPHIVIGVQGRWLDPNLAPFEFQDGFIPDWLNNSSQGGPPPGYDAVWQNWVDTGYDLYEKVILRKI